MKLGHAIIGVIVVGLLSPSFAKSDVRPTPITRSPESHRARLEVSIDPAGDVSILRISQAELREAGYELRKIEPQKLGDGSPSSGRSIIAALAMSLGIAGVFLTRKRRTAAIATGVVSSVVVATMCVQAWGNLAPIPREVTAPTPTIKLGPVVPGDFDPNTYLRSRHSIDNSNSEVRTGDLLIEHVNYYDYFQLSRLSWQRGPRLSIDSLSPILSPAAPKTSSLKSLQSMPTSIPFGVDGLTPDFANLLQLKPSTGGVRVDRSSNFDYSSDPRRNYYHGDVVIELTDGDQGVQLTLGTKPTYQAPTAAATTDDKPSQNR